MRGEDWTDQLEKHRTERGTGSNPTGEHKIPIIGKIFGQRLCRPLVGLAVEPSSSSPTALGGDGLVQRVESRRPRQGCRRNEDVRTNVDGEAAGAAAGEAQRALVVLRPVGVVMRGPGLEHLGRFSGERVAVHRAGKVF